MPLYDFVVMVKPAVDRRGLVELMKRLGERVYSRNGVVTNIKSFGRVNLAYGIRKRDGRFFEVCLNAALILRLFELIWDFHCMLLEWCAEVRTQCQLVLFHSCIFVAAFTSLYLSLFAFAVVDRSMLMVLAKKIL